MKLSAPSLLVGAVAVALPAYVFRVAVVHPIRVIGVPSAHEMVRGTWYGVIGASQTETLTTVPLDKRLVIVALKLDNGASVNLVDFLEVEASGAVNPVHDRRLQTEPGSVLPVALQPGSDFTVTSPIPTSPFLVAWAGYYEAL